MDYFHLIIWYCRTILSQKWDNGDSMKNDDWLLFAKVAQYKSFSEAARRLSMPITTVSRRIQYLESQLGERLFIRSTRSVTPTDLGYRLLPKTLILEAALKELHSTIENNSSEVSGKLKLSTSDTFAQFLIPNLLASFSNQYPLVEFDILSSNRNEKIINDSIDFSFRVGQLDDSNLIAYKLCDIEYVIVASPSFIKNATLEITIETLRQHPCILIHVDGKEFSWCIAEQNNIVELNINKKYRIDNLYAVKSLAELGLGIALLPKFLIKDAISANTLVTILDNIQIQKSRLNLVYFEKNYLSDKSKVFLQHIKDQQEQISDMVNPKINF